MSKYTNILLQNKQNVLHTQDLSLLWSIEGNTLYTTIKRYCAKNILNRVYKGMYVIGDLEDISPLLLGVKALNRYSYISTETILEQAGVINQRIPHITLISSVSRRFKINEHSFICRQLQDKHLYQTTGIIEKNNIKIATIERAVADLLYFNAKFYFDNPKLINWNKVKIIQQQIYANTKT